MKTSHRADGPGGFVRPGPGSLRAAFANDNSPRTAANGCPATGIVLSMEQRGNGVSIAVIRLIGLDQALSAPIHTATDTSEIIALWRGFGRDLNLPLYLRDASGVMTPVTPLTGDVVHGRCKGSPLSHRRPRFLTRRRTPLVNFTLPDTRREGQIG